VSSNTSSGTWRPFTGSAPSGFTWTKPSASASVSAEIRIDSGTAICSILAATWVVWPTAV
jgi:N-methylhydantoinase B/oxoprolinase/acetone carboxylase alpha subunit